MDLPTDYPEDFSHSGLREVWFEGIPWSVQQAVVGVNPRLRCIRNPATSVFVIVIKTDPMDRDQHFPFFNTATLFGWMPIIETKQGQPVEAVHKLVEIMQVSERHFAAQYGQTRESISRRLVQDRIEGERKKDRKMKEMSRFTRQYSQNFRMNPVHGLGMGMSPRRRFEKFRDAQSDFLVARSQFSESLTGAPLIVVP